MHVCLLTLIALMVASRASCEASKETLSPAPGDTQPIVHSETAPSRVKRRSYDMLRWTRGLNMLRLGKRSDSSNNPEFETNQLLTLEDEYPDSSLYQGSSDDTYYKALAALEGEYEPRMRYRRSTPSDDQMVTPIPELEGERDVITTNNDMKLPEDFEDEYSGFFPKWTYAVVDDGADEREEEDDDDDDDDELGSEEAKQKRQLQMLRLGKRVNGEGMNSLAMLRLGKRQDENLNTDFTENGEKKSLMLLRLGKRELSEEQKKNINMLRLGKRQLPMLRLGKRQLNMLRLGKRQLNMLRLGKRQLNMLRLGKRQLPMLRLGKRQLNMLRLGKRQLPMLRLGKRQLNMLRLGKRQLNMLRLGKRQLNMLRLGKKTDEEKRNMNMLRLGKRSAGLESDMEDNL